MKLKLLEVNNIDDLLARKVGDIQLNTDDRSWLKSYLLSILPSLAASLAATPPQPPPSPGYTPSPPPTPRFYASSSF